MGDLTQALMAVVVTQQHAEVPWTSGLCSCFDDFSSCCYACMCPMCAGASAREDFDGSNWCFNCLCLNACVLRNVVREAYNIEGTCLGDCCTPFLCNCCALSQVLREVKARGSANSITAQTSSGQLVRVQTQEGSNQWSSSLFSCCDDIGICFYGWCCPWCSLASTMTKYDNSNWCFNCCTKNVCLSQSIIREGKYNIDGDCCTDILVPCCCMTCVICRLAREVKARGSINETRSIMQVAQAPAPPPQMGAPPQAYGQPGQPQAYGHPQQPPPQAYGQPQYAQQPAAQQPRWQA